LGLLEGKPSHLNTSIIMVTIFGPTIEALDGPKVLGRLTQTGASKSYMKQASFHISPQESRKH
jgi:hypothetical protein